MRKIIKAQITIVLILAILNVLACIMLNVPLNVWIREPLVLGINFMLNVVFMMAFIMEENIL
mgnify:CR=1 FL=1